MHPATATDVAAGLKRIGHYRVVRAQEAAAEGPADMIDGALLLAFMCRETWGRNVEGGAKWDDTRKRWIALDPKTEWHLMDTGAFQISRRYHLDVLRQMPGVKAGTWTPVIEGKSAADGGHCPRFEEGLWYTLGELQASIDYARAQGIPKGERVAYAAAAHNAGRGGALWGYRNGDVDMRTAGGDYSRWVLQARQLIRVWLDNHAGWKA